MPEKQQGWSGVPSGIQTGASKKIVCPVGFKLKAPPNGFVACLAKPWMLQLQIRFFGTGKLVNGY